MITDMVRTQIQLTDSQASTLKALATAEGRSMADLIREGVDAILRARGTVDREAVKSQEHRRRRPVQVQLRQSGQQT